jgi:hypothetical protein
VCAALGQGLPITPPLSRHAPSGSNTIKGDFKLTFTKTAAIAAIVAAVALGTSMTAANAHGKKHHHHGLGHHHHYKPHFHGTGGLIILSTSVSPCSKWLRRYKRSGYKPYLYRYHACIR